MCLLTIFLGPAFVFSDPCLRSLFQNFDAQNVRILDAPNTLGDTVWAGLEIG